MVETSYSFNNQNKKLYLNFSSNIPGRPCTMLSEDRYEKTNKDITEKNKKPVLSNPAISIAALASGVFGIGFAIRTRHINKELNKKVTSILESAGIKSSSSKSYFERNMSNLRLLEEMLIKDKLTGLFNRRYFDEYFNNAFNKAKRNDSDIHVLMFNISKFRMINTALGNEGGDAVLQHSSRAIKQVLDKYRQKGIELLLARYDNKKFALIVEGEPKDKALTIAQEIRLAVNKNNDLRKHVRDAAEFYENEANKLRVQGEHKLTKRDSFMLSEYELLHAQIKENKGFTVNIGLCSFREHNKTVSTPGEAVKLTEIALDRAGNSGSNGIHSAEADDLPVLATYLLKDARAARKILPHEKIQVCSEIILNGIKKLKQQGGQEDRIIELEKLLTIN